MHAAALWFAVQEELEAKRETGLETERGSALDALDDDLIFRTFHLSRAAVTFVTDCVRGALEPPADSAVLAALCFYAHGSVRPDAADALGLTPDCVGRAVDAVSVALAQRLKLFVTFPGSHGDRALVAHDIYRRYGVPNVVGALGCLHAPVAPPAGEEALYLNRGHFHSLACQMACDSQGNLLSVEEPRPGGAAEQSVWEASRLCAQFAGGKHGHCWLVGACDTLCCNFKHVLTPLTCVKSHPGIRYNEAHFKIQSIIHQTFGAMKVRFQCLKNLGPIEKSAPHRLATIIKACCVLHNIAKKFSVPLPGELVPEAAYHGPNREENNIKFNLTDTYVGVCS
uniref:Putative nuclease HARBI1 n=1 Tax=Scleropages formosus TaxID=113540 RepID=A0A8C9WQ60_SCLFO